MAAIKPNSTIDKPPMTGPDPRSEPRPVADDPARLGPHPAAAHARLDAPSLVASDGSQRHLG